MGDHGDGGRVTEPAFRPAVASDADSQPAELPRALAEYADQLLLGTGLDAHAALLVASGRQDASDELVSLAAALRAGWQLAEAQA